MKIYFLIAILPLTWLSAEEHWSLRAPVKSPVPALAENPIDAFVQDKLAKETLAPSPLADRLTLVRRVFLDVIGLPPSPEEAAAFLNDPAPDAFEHLVDRLLASPRFGERWARNWLDVVRFAETHGFEMNQERPNAWPYRDYVIQAFNSDLPYDRFVLEQLAGDVLGSDAATGFIVGGSMDQVTSPDPVLTANQRADELHDMVSTTGTAFLGLSVGCARCHDHKFDPISQTEYFALRAAFEGVRHGERPLQGALVVSPQQETAALRRQIADTWRKLDADAPLATTELRPSVNSQRNVERIAPVKAKWVRFVIAATTQAEPCLDELEIYATDSAENIAPQGRLTASGTYAGSPKHTLAHLTDGLHGNDFSWISDTPGKGWVTVELPEVREINGIVWGRDLRREFADRLAVQYQIEIATEPDAWRIVASSGNRQAFAPDAVTTVPKEIVSLEARLKSMESPPLIYGGTFQDVPPPTMRLNRGDPMQPRELVNAAGIAAVPVAFTENDSVLLPSIGKICGQEISRPPTENQRRRLALAQWIASPANPLTARVIANRLWQQHFGEGLVSTPSDFGHNGSRPSHPELLDWLACELMEHGWSLKHLHRLILTSHTFQQASEARPEAMIKDAGDQWLWRFRPRRLDAEVLHDTILSVSGQLDLRMGGPGFSGFEPNTNYVRVYNAKLTFSGDDFRRMIYMTKVRMQPEGTFGAFDCPDAGQVAPKRNRSTTPLQALNLLNSPFMLQQATALAERVQQEAPGGQVERAFMLCFGRSPTSTEASQALVLVTEHGLPALARALLNANEFVTLP